MFDLGWTELLLIGIVALIVVGPKDLPLLFRKVGKFVGKARGMAREFSRAMDDAADEAGVKEVSKSLKAASNPLQSSLDEVKKATSDLKRFSSEGASGKSATKGAKGSQNIHEGHSKKVTTPEMAETTVKNKSRSKNSIDRRKKTSKKAIINAVEASKD